MVNISNLSELNDILGNSFANIKKDMMELKSSQREQLSGTNELSREIDLLKTKFVDNKAFQKEVRELQSALRTLDKKASEKDVNRLVKNIEGMKVKDVDPKDLAFQDDVKDIRKSFDDLVKNMNKRLNDLNKQLQSIEDSKKYVTNVSNNFSNKIKRVNDNAKDIHEIKLAMAKLGRTYATLKELAELRKTLLTQEEIQALILQASRKLVSKEEVKVTLEPFVVEEQVEAIVSDVNAEFDKLKGKMPTDANIKKYIKKYKLDYNVEIDSLKRENSSLKEDLSDLRSQLSEVNKVLAQHKIVDKNKKGIKKGSKGKYEFK
jgi:chromosome segregation ATPase